MKRQLLLSLSLSILAANAFAVPAADQHLSAEARSSAPLSQPLQPLAEGGSDRLIERRENRVAEGGSDRLIERRENRVAEGGSDRVIERNQRVS